MSFVFLSNFSLLARFLSAFLTHIEFNLFTISTLESIYVENINPDNLLKYKTIERLVFFISYALAALTAGYLIKFIKYDGVILMDFCAAFSFVAIENLYPAYLEKLGLSTNLIGTFISVQFICSSVYGLFVPRIKEHINPKILLYSLPLIRILLVLPVYIFNIPIFLIPAIFILQYILFVSYAPIKYTLFQNNIPNEYRATIISFQSQAIALGAILFYGFSSMLSFLSVVLIYIK